MFRTKCELLDALAREGFQLVFLLLDKVCLRQVQMVHRNASEQIEERLKVHCNNCAFARTKSFTKKVLTYLATDGHLLCPAGVSERRRDDNRFDVRHSGSSLDGIPDGFIGVAALEDHLAPDVILAQLPSEHDVAALVRLHPVGIAVALKQAILVAPKELETQVRREIGQLTHDL